MGMVGGQKRGVYQECASGPFAGYIYIIVYIIFLSLPLSMYAYLLYIILCTLALHTCIHTYIRRYGLPAEALVADISGLEFGDYDSQASC